MSHSYEVAFRHKMDEYHQQLWAHPELVPTLAPQTWQAVLTYLLELACQAQNIANITLGRTALWAIPRTWLLDHIEAAAEPLLQLEEDWEYRRLIELYWHLDIPLVRRLAIHGLASQNSDIREAASECLEKLTQHRLNDVQGQPEFDYWETPPVRDDSEEP